MPTDAFDASNRSNAGPGRRVATPYNELARLRESEAAASAGVRERIMEAMLELCGELGYRNVAVRHVLERYGGYRLQFYRHFDSKLDCYLRAYEAETERLCAAMLRAGAVEASWPAGLRAALNELAGFVRERPSVAKGLLTEVHVAGGPARLRRKEVVERLSRAIDSARRETESRHSPPPVTALFMVGATEESVSSALLRGAPEAFEAAIPELVSLIVTAYFGEDAGRDALAVAPVA